MKGFGKTRDLLGESPSFLSHPSRDSLGNLRLRPESASHLALLAGAMMTPSGQCQGGPGGGDRDPSLEEVLLEGWGGASAPAWDGQRLPPRGPQNPVLELLGRDPVAVPEGIPNFSGPFPTDSGGL